MDKKPNGESPYTLPDEVAQLKELVGGQSRRIEALESQLETATDGEPAETGRRTPLDGGFSRRSLLQAAGLAGLAGYGTAIAAAEPTGQIGSPDQPVRALYTESLGAGIVENQEVSSLLGTGLSVEEGALSAVEAAMNHVNVAEDGSTVLEDVVQLDFGVNLAVTDDDPDDGIVTVDAATVAVNDSSSSVIDNLLELDFRANLTVSDDGDGVVSIDSLNPAIEDSGSSVVDDVTKLNFNDNLNLTKKSDGSVEIDAVDTDTDTNTHTDVSDGGSTVVSNTDDIDFGSNLSVTDDGDGSVTVDGTSSSKWDDAGSNLLEPTGDFDGATNTDSLGSSSDSALTLNTDGGTRALELGVPGTDFDGNTGGANHLAGATANAIKADAVGGVIGGGGDDGGNENIVTDDYGTVGGGGGNQAGDDDSDNTDAKYATVSGGLDNSATAGNATVGGGWQNAASGSNSTIAGGFRGNANAEYATIAGGDDNDATGESSFVGSGRQNDASGAKSVIGGGRHNEASGSFSAVGGGGGSTAGDGNVASGSRSAVPGGRSNTADGHYSFASGRAADTNGKDGAFVWGDSSSTAATATAADEVRFQATGGFVIEDGDVTLEGSDGQGLELNSPHSQIERPSSDDYLMFGMADSDSGVIFGDSSGGSDDGKFIIRTQDNGNEPILFQQYASSSNGASPETRLEIDSNGDTSLHGNDLTQVGGTTDASSGAIRLGNDNQIRWRDSGDTADGVVKVDPQDWIILDTPNRASDPVKLSAPDIGNVTLSHLNDSALFFALDESNSKLKVRVQESDGTAVTADVITYSTARLKSNIQHFEGDPHDVFGVHAQTFTLGNGDGDESLGITAESAHEAGLGWLVDYVPIDLASRTAEGLSDEYLEQYAVERDGETVVPNDIDDRAWLAMHHEVLRELVDESQAECGQAANGTESDGEASQQQVRLERFETRLEQKADQIADLEAELEAKSERIDDLEARLFELERTVAG